MRAPALRQLLKKPAAQQQQQQKTSQSIDGRHGKDATSKGRQTGRQQCVQGQHWSTVQHDMTHYQRAANTPPALTFPSPPFFIFFSKFQKTTTNNTFYSTKYSFPLTQQLPHVA
jgi:hypothetical protein